ncbi:MAG TPA: Rpn family recombination-promoting nuclease/putative transposase, partial [Campylobacterales bacterium]|nr:Rpn family recombination-promoting nuclease/putative transposase [Campylobacterales bacterium]
MRFDISLKSALNGLERVFGKAFLGLDIRDAEPLNIEFPKIEEKEADYIFKAKLSNNQSVIVHIEFQTSNHKDMHFRMLRYLTEIYKTYKLPIVQLVLYLGSKKLRMKDNIAFEIEDTKLDYKYKIVDMKTLDCRVFLESDESDMTIMALLCDMDGKDKNELTRAILHKLFVLSDGDENSYRNSLLKLETLSELRNLQHIVKEEEAKMIDTRISVEKLPSYMIGF